MFHCHFREMNGTCTEVHRNSEMVPRYAIDNMVNNGFPSAICHSQDDDGKNIIFETNETD